MVMLKIQWAQPARKCKYPHSEQQQMPREQKPAINWSFKKIIHNLCQQTRKGLKWFQSTVMDQKKSKKSVQSAPTRASPNLVPSSLRGSTKGRGDSTASVQLNHFNKAAPFLKVMLGVHFWLNGCPGRRAEEQARKNRSAFYQTLVSYVFNSTPSARLHKHTGVESFKLHIILYCSFTTAQPATKKRT